MIIKKFGAGWCDKCTALDSLNLDGLKNAIKVDADEELHEVIKYNLDGLPTVLILDEDDNITEKYVGYDAIVKKFS